MAVILKISQLILKSYEKEAIDAFLERLRNSYSQNILQAVLFGSKARGDSLPDSDIDILLISNQEDWRFRHRIIDIASDASLDYDVLISPRIIAQNRWEQMQREKFSLCESIAREGIPLAF